MNIFAIRRNHVGLLLSCLIAASLLLGACGSSQRSTDSQQGSGTSAGTSSGASSNSPSSAQPAKEPATEPAKEPFTIRMGHVTCTPLCGFRNMADKKGYFAEEGITVEYFEIADNVNLTKALLTGELEVLEANFSVAMDAVMQGNAKLKVLGSMNPGLAFILYADQSVQKPEDLIGKVVAISTPGALPHILVKQILESHGLSDSGVTFTPAGNNAQRVQALLAGTVNATPSLFDFETQIEGTDLHIPVRFSRALPNYIQTPMTVTEEFYNKHEDVVRRFLRAYSKGIRYAFAHPDEAAELAAEILKQPVEKVRPAIDRYIDNEILTADFAISKEQMQYMLDLQFGKDQGPKVESVLNSSIAEEISKELN